MGYFHGIMRLFATGVLVFDPSTRRVISSGHVLFGEAVSVPAPSKEHPRMLEIVSTPRLIEEFEYLERMTARGNISLPEVEDTHSGGNRGSSPTGRLYHRRATRWDRRRRTVSTFETWRSC